MNDGLSSSERIQFGLETISEGQKVEVSLKDLMHVHQMLSELNGFFHQPINYENIDDLSKFLGNVDKGAYKELHNCLYTVMDRMLPKEIEDRFEDFDPGGSPNYDNT